MSRSRCRSGHRTDTRKRVRRLFKRRRRDSRAGAPNPVAAAPPLEGHGPPGAERATFAAGCFWGVEAAFREIDGVLDTSAGYTGGHQANPSYGQVRRHRTGHAEAVEVWFDPERVSYSDLLGVFWRIHNPTSRNRQGWDFGSQYRSAIYFHNPEQGATAVASLNDQQGLRTKQIVTEIAPASAFYRAEDYHQRYLEKQGRAASASTVR
jgi:peptide-methionine (S)-S-oxide reductase